VFWGQRSFDSPHRTERERLARSTAWSTGFFADQKNGRSDMANHLTPEELSKELGIDRQEVIRVCVEEGVPIYQGKIDKTLFAAQLQALGAFPEKH
jgi:hypothetical protein